MFMTSNLLLLIASTEPESNPDFDLRTELQRRRVHRFEVF